MSSVESQLLPKSYTWTFPGSPVRVQIRLSVINELHRLLKRPARFEQGGASGCGLLVGDGPRPGATEISGFESLPALNPAGVEDAKRRAASHVVGFYRTTEKGSLCMSEQDLSLARTHFSDPHSVVLLIETDQTGPGNAVFFFWDQGQMYGDLALMEFPFDADQLGRNEQVRARAREEIIPDAEKRGPDPRRSRIRRVRPLPIAVALGIGAIAGHFYFSGGRKTGVMADKPAAALPVSAAPSLGLSIERRGSDLLLSWDRLSAPIRRANFGEVIIREGDASRKLQLNAQQLRSGSILYAPTTDQVEMQLNVVNGEKVTGESMTAILPPVGPHPLVGLITSAQTFESPRQPNEPVARRPAAVGASMQPTAGTEPRHPASADRELRKFSIPRGLASQRSAATVPITEPPPAVAGNSLAGTLGSPLNWQLPAIPAPASTPVPATLARTNGAQDHTIPTPGAAPVNHQTAVPRPPVPTRQVTPRFPSDIKQYLISNTPVKVLVHIDAQGEVIRAEPISKQSANVVLIQAALDAARGWAFQPATVGTTPVASEMVLEFNFSPTR